MNLWNNKNNPANTFNEGFHLIELILGVSLFLSSFFFLPFTVDYIEVNKAHLYMLTAILVFLAFAFQGYKRGSLYIKSFRYYLPFFVILVGGILSVYFSVNVRSSLFGGNGSYLQSFLVLVAYCLIAFVVVNTKLNIRNLIRYFLLGSLITTLIAFSGFYAPLLPYLAKLLPSTILSDSYGGLLALLVFNAVLSFYYLFFNKKAPSGAIVYYLILILSLTYLVVLPTFYSLLALALGLGYLILTQKDFDFNKNMVGITAVGVFVVVLSVLHYIPPIKEAIGFNPLNDFPRLDIVSSWYVAASSLIGRPFWGYGLNNYATAMSEFRPGYLNGDVFWNLRYNYPFNDLFLWLTTGGIVGLAAYIIFMGTILAKTLDKRDVESRDGVLPVIIMLIFIATFLLGSNSSLTLLFFIVAAVLFQNNRGSVFAFKTTFPRVTALGLALILLALFAMRSFGVYLSQYYLNQSLLSEDLLTRYNLQRAAIANNQIDPSLYREAILTNLEIANRIAAQEDVTDEQKTLAENLLKQAIDDSVVLTEVLDPLTASNWGVRGVLNKSLIGLDGEDKRFSIIAAQSYLSAIRRDPTNPLLRIELGNIYYQNKDYGNAANYFIQAIQLKNDYANGYYNLAYALKDAGDYQNALIQMQVVERLIPDNSPDRENITKEVEELKKLAEENKNNTSSNVAIPDSVKTPEVNANAKDSTLNQTVVGPEETGTFDLKDENLDVQPVGVNEEDTQEPASE